MGKGLTPVSDIGAGKSDTFNKSPFLHIVRTYNDFQCLTASLHRIPRFLHQQLVVRSVPLVSIVVALHQLGETVEGVVGGHVLLGDQFLNFLLDFFHDFG